MGRIILIYYVVLNIITFILYGADKRKAVKGGWRISEKILLLLPLSGGCVGQIAGMTVFHHKTRKWYFKLCAVLFLALHIVILYLYFTKWKFFL